ncbi:MAG: sigma-70 family RNA polymerase sigma factor [Armatimonadetes bacterium]|nr:sigma-70 family RNA polymerase sigma factor [Armatimonadota bacterium]
MRITNTEELVAEYLESKNAALRDAIVVQLNGLVESLARKMNGLNEPMEDLVQEGYIGLLKALEAYDPTKGVLFTTYATHLIVGQIRHYFRDKGKIIKEPAWLQEMSHKVNKTVQELTQANGQAPTVEQIAERAELPCHTVEEVFRTRDIFKVASLDAPTDDDESDLGFDLDKVNGDEDSTVSVSIEDRIFLQSAIHRLKDIEQRVLGLFFYEGLNQTETAKRLGISCNYVSHILRNATQKLRRMMMEEELLDQQKRRQGRGAALSASERSVDAPSGLYSKEYATARLDEEIQRSTRYGSPVAMAILRLTNLERAQFAMGGLTASELMAEAANEARSVVRRADVLARFDDTSLIIVLPHAGHHAQQVAERAKEQIEEWLANVFEAAPGRPTASVGWASFPFDGLTANELELAALDRIEGADEPMPMAA